MIEKRVISGLFLLLAFLVMPSPALKCYECNSKDSDDEPICDRLYWKQLDSAKWANLSIDCIATLSSFCVATWKIEGSGAKSTKRGCMGKKDSQGTRLNAGCIDISESEKTCLCTDDLCNSSPAVFSTSFIILTISYAVSSSFVLS